MKRKTVNSILKGVAGVGLTLGGVSALSDANLVYANEVEQPTQATVTEEVVNAEETPSTESAQSDSSETGESSFEDKRQEYLDSQPDATCTMNTVAAAIKEAADTAKEAAKATEEEGSAEDDAPSSEEGSEGESGSEGEDTTQGQTGNTTQTPEEGNTDQDQEESSEESSEETPELKELREKMEAKLEFVNDIVKGQKKENGGNGTINGTKYYRAADELVKLMIEYYAAVEGFDGDIEFNNGYCSNKWVSNGIDHNNNFKQNYLETTYKDALGAILDKIYYDYVNADAEGRILTGTTNENNAELIHHIVVYEKTPVFAVDDKNGSFSFDKDGNFSGTNDSFTFVRDECRNIVAYIIDGEKIEVKVNENGERYIVDLENEDGSIVTTTTVTGNNNSGYTVTKTTFEKNADGEMEQTSASSKTYKELKGFSSGNKGKGEFYKKDLPREPENNQVTEDYTPGPSEPFTLATPQLETPETEIEDEDVPLADVPDVADEDIDTDDDLEEDLDEDVTDLEDEDVPLAVLDLDEPVDIPDADVPLSDNPETGDALTATWIGTAAASVAGLFGASRKKRKG